MKRHTITEDELADWLSDQWHQFAGSFDEGTDKRFFANAAGDRFQVMDHGVTIYDGNDITEAVKAYNDAP